MSLINQLLEKLAELEHEQWVYWTKELEKRYRTDPAWQYQLEQWRKSWIPYSELSEGQKEMDRIHARKVLDLINRLDLKEIARGRGVYL